MKKVELKLETLTCPSCIKKIETTLSKAEGVNAVKVLFNSNKVKAEIDEGQTSADKLKEIVSNLGYEVLELKA